MVAVYEAVIVSIYELERFGVHDVMRLHTNYPDCHYQQALSAIKPSDPRTSFRVLPGYTRNTTGRLVAHKGCSTFALNSAWRACSARSIGCMVVSFPLRAAIFHSTALKCSS